MLAAQLSQLNLQGVLGPERMDDRGGEGQILVREYDGNANSMSNRMFTPPCPHKPHDNVDGFAVPRIPSSSCSKSKQPTKMKQFGKFSKNTSSAPTPTPRQSSSECPNLSQGYADIVSFSTQLISKMEKIKRSGKGSEQHGVEFFRSPVRRPSHSEDIQTPSSSTSSMRQNPPLSAELSKLCSGSRSSGSAFKSDSDNSSCLFANESFLSSSDFTDDVFGDVDMDESKQTLLKSKLGFSESRGSYSMQDSLSEDVSVEFYDGKQKSDLVTGAALIGSPSKVRNQGSRSIRRVKSVSSVRSSVRYSPFKLSPRKLLSQSYKPSNSATRWYKAKTDTYLYEIRKNAFRELDAMPDLPKRKLHFDEPDNNQSPQVEVQKLADLVARTETPESGYDSLNSTRQTPDLLRADTPVNRTRSKTVIAFSTPTCSPLPVLAPTQINTCPIPWLEKFDVISRFHRFVPNIVNRILIYLEPKDLVLFSSVSTQWRNICSSCHPYAAIRDRYLKEQREDFQRRKENLHSSSRSGRKKMTGQSTPLGSVQFLGRPAAESTPLRPVSNFEKFHQAARQLEKGQSLGKCKCGSPARIEPKSSKALCSSVHCQNEFCVNCRMRFHGNSPCASPVGRSRPRGPSVGSKKSKSNLRRHSRLSAKD